MSLTDMLPLDFIVRVITAAQARFDRDEAEARRRRLMAPPPFAFDAGLVGVAGDGAAIRARLAAQHGPDPRWEALRVEMEQNGAAG